MSGGHPISVEDIPIELKVPSPVNLEKRCAAPHSARLSVHGTRANCLGDEENEREQNTVSKAAQNETFHLSRCACQVY